jgi:hypothetical protein
MRLLTIISIFLFLLPLSLDATDDLTLFFETFEDIDSIEANGGVIEDGDLSFVNGVIGNAGDFSGSPSGSLKVCYPLNNNFNFNNGTVEFLVKMPDKDGLGFFDIGKLGTSHSWGIFKNQNEYGKIHIIMEVKKEDRNYDHAASPSIIKFDNNWHHISAVWVKEGEKTKFKICYDGRCKDDPDNDEQYYDGVQIGSSPDLDGDFCVGWCGYYGSSDSYFDEFKIFNYTKSDAEILDACEGYFPNACKCEGESNDDGDVDGSDLAAYITNVKGISIYDFADEFGRINCP